jgi:hypothetical protein
LSTAEGGALPPLLAITRRRGVAAGLAAAAAAAAAAVPARTSAVAAAADVVAAATAASSVAVAAAGPSRLQARRWLCSCADAAEGGARGLRFPAARSARVVPPFREAGGVISEVYGYVIMYG